MKIAYIANIRMPTERAHGVQIAKTCEAFVRAGMEVELVVPNRRTPITEDVFTYYGLRERSAITKTFALDLVDLDPVGFFLETLTFTLSALWHVRKAELIYGRDEFVLAVLALFGHRIVWESHTGAWNLFARLLAAKAEKIVVISEGLKEFYRSKRVSENKLIVAHDGVDLNDFQGALSKGAARERLGLDQHEHVALYVGGLGGWKGAETLLKASEYLKEFARVVVIGGAPGEVQELQLKFPRVKFLGERPYRDLKNSLATADVLILPTSAKSMIGKRFTSPLKLFAYMASGRPIIASNVPTTREVLPEKAAYWFEPDSAEDLARAVREALSDEHRSDKANIALREVARYTWDTRARTILAHMSP